MKKKDLIPILFLIAGMALFHFRYGWFLVLLGIGLLIGFYLYHLDHLIYCFFQAPHELSSQRIMSYFRQKSWKQAFSIASQTENERSRTIFHSVVFQVALILAGFFILTSSTSLLGKGMVLGLLFHSVFDQGLRLVNKENLDSWFWQIQTSVPENIQKLYFFIILVIFVILATFFV